MSSAPPKKLNLFDATMLVMGGIVGIGIFFQPASVAKEVPLVGPYLLMWVLGGLVAVAGAMTFAELSGSFPKAGGWYVFLREAFGAFPAFLFAWIVLFVVSTGASALVADFCASQFCTMIWGADQAPEGARMALAAGILIAVTGLALTGIKRGALFQNLCTLLKLGAIAVLSVAGLAFFDGAAVPIVASAVPAYDGDLMAGMIRAAMPLLFTFGGWQLVCYIGQHVENPERNLPRSILFGVCGVVIVYLVFNAAYLRVLGIDGLRSLPDIAGTLAHRTLGSLGGTLLVGAMAISALGLVTAVIVSTPGLYVAMSDEGLFPRAIGRPHPRTGAPSIALCLQCVVALGYLAYGSERVDKLTTTVVFAEWIFHTLCGLALIRLRYGRPELPRPFRSFAFPLFPVLYTLIGAAVTLGTLAESPWEETRTGLIILGIGALIYPLWRRVSGTRAA